MYIIPIAWIYVALMMAVAEATSSKGSILGAVITFVLYGIVPVLLVLYLMMWPARRKRIKAREAEDTKQYMESTQPDASSHAPATAESNLVAPVRKEP